MRGLPATALTRVVRAEGGRRSASHSAGHPARTAASVRARAMKDRLPRSGGLPPVCAFRPWPDRIRQKYMNRIKKKELPKISYFDIVTSMVGT
jgi:hypothetical protein